MAIPFFKYWKSDELKHGSQSQYQNVCNEHLDENTNLFKEWKRIESKHGGHLQDHNVYMDFKIIGW